MSGEGMEKIGKYRIIGELGHGGMGLVYLAEDMNLGRKVALKVLLDNFATDEVFKQRFRQEARSISQITHPNVVQIHSMDEIDECLVIDMEYIEGQPLSDILKKTPMTPDWLVHITKDILEGLSTCHNVGLVHRDIKPSNILLTLSGQAKIADFGIAKALAESSAMAIELTHSTTAFLGTPRFTPPEAWDGVAANPSWDIYSLGILLYEALIGKPAFHSTSMLSLMKEISLEALAPIDTIVEGISPEFSRLIMDMVNSDPDQRIQTADEALKQLVTLPETEGVKFLDDNTITIPILKPVSVSLTQKSSATIEPAVSRIPSFVSFGILGVCIIMLMLILQLSLSDTPFDDSGLSKQATPSIAKPVKNSSQYWWASSVEETSGQGWQLHWDLTSGLTEQHIVAYHDYSMMFLNAKRSGDRIELEGEWAGCRTLTGVGLRSGMVSGTGIIHGEEDSITLTLEFKNDRDHSAWTETFHVVRDTTQITAGDFARGIEGGKWLPSLLQDEIFPNSLLVGNKIDALLPSAQNQRVIAPKISSEDEPVIDGHLDDALWVKRYFGDEGRVGELMSLLSDNQEVIHIRHDGNTLYFSLQVGNITKRTLGLEFSMRQIVDNPTSSSMRGEMHITNRGKSEFMNFRGNGEIPFRMPWKAASQTNETQWTVEWSVPLDEAIDLNGVVRLRFVAVLWTRDATGAKTTLTHWGVPNIKQVAHGSLLIPANN